MLLYSLYGLQANSKGFRVICIYLLHVGITVTSDPKGCGTAGKRIIFEFSSIFEFYH